MNRRLALAAAFVTCGLPVLTGGTSVRGEPLPDSFTLGRYVPDSCVAYVHRVQNPKRAGIEKHWRPIFDAVKKLGVLEELGAVVASSLAGGDRAGFEEFWTRAVELGKAVSWGDLVDRETVVALSMSPLPSVLVLCNGKPGTGKQNLAGLLSLLEHVASLDEGLEVSKRTCCGMEAWSLTVPGAPVSVEVFARGDVICVSTSPLLAGGAASLMIAKDCGGAIVDAPRFRAGLASLPEPQDGVFFCDWRSAAAGIRHLLEAAANHAGESRVVTEILTHLNRIVGRVDVLDYTVGVQWTENWRERYVSVSSLQPEARDKTLARVFANRRPLGDPLATVPVEATSFWSSAGIDCGLLYSLVLDVIEQDLPDGQQALAKWQSIQEQIGFNLRDDLLSWVSGEFVYATIPRPKPTPLLPADTIVLFRVTDPELATRKVRAGLERVKSLAWEHLKQPCMIAPASTVEAEGFVKVKLPLLGILPSPVVGVHDDWLIVSTCEGVVNKYLATITGRRPSVASARRFRREGIPPSGAVCYSSFRDLRNHGDVAAQKIMLAKLVGMGLALVPDQPDRRPLQTMVGMLTRLEPVIRRIDFLSSSSSLTTFDGTTWRTEGVLTYKPVCGQ